MDDGDPKGLSEGISSSQGDPRVLLLLNVLLSASFGATIVWGLSLLDAAELSLINIATATIVLFALTYLVTNT
jgi:hypothetical protein